MKKIFLLNVFLLIGLSYAQANISKQDTLYSTAIPDLIPQKINGKIGYVNHKSEFVIAPQFNLAMFFNEDCNLLNSNNAKAKVFGTPDYATVEYNKVAYRINKKGKRVYKYESKDLVKCPSQFKSQKYKAYVMQGFYGLVQKENINERDYREFVIYPQYQRLHVMESDDIENPMIVAVYNNKFGVIDKNAKVIIPFVYNDIKLNYSWKLGKMFEVSVQDGEYFYVDKNNKAY